MTTQPAQTQPATPRLTMPQQVAKLQGEAVELNNKIEVLERRVRIRDKEIVDLKAKVSEAESAALKARTEARQATAKAEPKKPEKPDLSNLHGYDRAKAALEAKAQS